MNNFVHKIPMLKTGAGNRSSVQFAATAQNFNEFEAQAPSNADLNTNNDLTTQQEKVTFRRKQSRSINFNISEDVLTEFGVEREDF